MDGETICFAQLPRRLNKGALEPFALPQDKDWLLIAIVAAREIGKGNLGCHLQRKYGSNFVSETVKISIFYGFGISSLETFENI